MEPRKFYSETAGFYNFRHESPTTRHLRKLEKRVVERFADGITLDAGCGTGSWLGHATVGLDVSEAMLREARTSGKQLVQGRLEAMPFSSGSFDTIMCMLSVLSVCDHEKAAAEFSRTLRKGGRAIVSVASVWDKNYTLKQKFQLNGRDPDGRLVRTGKSKKFYILGKHLNIRLFNKTELMELFEKNGFALEFFDSAFIWQKPVWNDLRTFGPVDKTRLALERLLPYKDFGCYYVMVFRKMW
jgi:ubiquinone/menaquinone biosynthesis C-methylase UbiE